MAPDLTSIQSGIVQGNNVNDPTPRTLKGHNQFPQSFQHPSTCQYGYVDPVAVAKCEVGDVFPYKFVTDLNTFTMKSPLKSEVKMYSAAFKVPMEAIYPRTYDILFSFAQKGDTVPQGSPGFDGVLSDGGSSARALFPVKDFTNAIVSYINNLSHGTLISSDRLDHFIRSILLLESVFSDGSIFSKMNIHLNSLLWVADEAAWIDTETKFFDDIIDNVFFPKFLSYLQPRSDSPFYIMHESGGTDESEGYPIYIPTSDFDLYNMPLSSHDAELFDGRGFYCSIDRMLELMRSGDWHIYLTYPADESNYSGFSKLFFNLLFDASAKLPSYLNIEPIIAYQLACVHFFNNPKVDYLYTADLWRDNLQTLASAIYDDSNSALVATFDYNGSHVLYDVVSEVYLTSAISNIRDSVVDASFDYLFHLFSFSRSLRYGDYFTGSRPEPIGVGDITLDEGSDGISSLEVARKLQLTRLLHKVAITGPEHKDQLKVVFGGRIPEAPKDVPIRLSLEEFDIDGFEVNNTGDAQLSSDDPNITTTNLRLSDSKFMFEVEVNEPCWLVMVQYFEAHRIYSNTIDRFAYHYNLYDDFVPDMQFIGDQDVKQSELLGIYGSQFDPFSYNLRYMEYKQRYSYASGGFIRHLPSWAFITDNHDGNPADANITPEYIRSSPSEFDRFYKSLTGHSLGSRFHFITMNTNVMAPYRQMVYAPEILA